MRLRLLFLLPATLCMACSCDKDGKDFITSQREKDLKYANDLCGLSGIKSLSGYGIGLEVQCNNGVKNE